MFRHNLVAYETEDVLFSVSTGWMKKYPWLVRVPFFDENEPQFVYVNAYSEKSQEYVITKYIGDNGDVVWQSHVVNGGYGTPAVLDDVVVALDGFDSITLLDKKTGCKRARFRYGERIRSSVNVIDGLAWFSHGGHIVSLTSAGEEVSDFHVPGAFLYGAISRHQDLLLVTGTRFAADKGVSDKYLWAVDINSGRIHYEVDLGQGSIISSDTSGAWLSDDRVLVANNDLIACLDAESGKELWSSTVFGNVHRHVVVTDGVGLFYTTLKGEIGSLSLLDGHRSWSRRTEERIVSPPAIVGGSLLACADASLYVLNKRTGSFYQKIPIGHLPYSAPVIWRDRVYVGAGEPPSNGTMISLELNRGIGGGNEVASAFSVGSSIESARLSLCATFRNAWDEARLDPSVISSSLEIAGDKVGSNTFYFDVPLKPRNVEGKYVLPITAVRSGLEKTFGVEVELKRTCPLPAATTIAQFNQEVQEIDYLNSGSALIQMVEAHYGKRINQKDFREIIDYLKEKSRWEDADFQTWRLIMKRALTSPAYNLEEFVELEAKGERALKKVSE